MEQDNLHKKEGKLVVGVIFGMLFSAISFILYVFAVYTNVQTLDDGVRHPGFFIDSGILFWLLLVCVISSLILLGYSGFFAKKYIFHPKSNQMRITRLEFILDFIVYLVLGFIIGGVAGGIVSSIFHYFFWSNLVIFHLSWFILSIRLIIGRLRDCDYPKRLVWLYFIPGINILFHFFLSFKPGTVGDNRYGPDPLGINEKASIEI